jgi:high-affinity iron transporter
MIFWMHRQAAAWCTALAANVRTAVSATRGWGLFGVAFLAVAREGIELALLLVATTLSGSVTATAPGAALGIAAAALTGVPIRLITLKIQT